MTWIECHTNLMRKECPQILARKKSQLKSWSGMIPQKLTGNECPQILTSYLMLSKLPWLHLLPTLVNVTFLGEQLKVQVSYNPPDSSLYKTQVERKFSRPNTHCGIHEFFSSLVRQCRRRGLRGGVGELPGMNRVGAANVQNFCIYIL